MSNKTISRSESASSASAKLLMTLTLPANRPSTGAALFAYTYALAGIILALPKAKQYSIARIVHGAAAMKHHGPQGTNKIRQNADGSVFYDLAYFTIGEKSTDSKRRAVPIDWVSYYRAFTTGKPYPVPNGIKALTPKDTIRVTI